MHEARDLKKKAKIAPQTKYMGLWLSKFYSIILLTVFLLPLTCLWGLQNQTAVLGCTLSVFPTNPKVGENITVEMIVTLQDPEILVINVTPSTISISGTGNVVLISGPVPEVANFSIGEFPVPNISFTWTFRATAPGSITFSGYAEGYSPDLEEEVQSDVCSISIDVEEALMEGLVDLECVEISANITEALVNETIRVEAVIVAEGNFSQLTSKVGFYLGPPEEGKLLAVTSANFTQEIPLRRVWCDLKITQEGEYEIYVYVDYPNEIDERDEENNVCNVEVIASLPTYPTSTPPPPTETPIPPTETETPPPSETESPPPPTSPAVQPTPTGAPKRRGVERYAYVFGILTAAALLTYAVLWLKPPWLKPTDPCKDLAALRRRLDTARSAKKKLLDQLDRIRKDADRISREISELESKATKLEAELRKMWSERDDLKHGKLPKAVVIAGDKVFVWVGKQLERLSKLEDMIPKMENKLAGLRSQILKRESAIDSKLREANELWSEIRKANKRVEETNNLIYECLSKLKGPCDDLDLLRSRVSELERELEAMKALISLSKEDSLRLERAIEQAGKEIKSQLRTAQMWEDAAKRMRSGEPRFWIRYRGVEANDLDFRLLRMEENMLAARFKRKEISKDEFLRAYKALQPPITKEVIERLRKKAHEAASQLEARANKARDRAESLKKHLENLKRMKSAAEARTKSLKKKEREISKALEKARRRLDECERRVRDYLLKLDKLRGEIRSTLRSYKQKRTELIIEAVEQTNAIDDAVDETPYLVGEIQKLCKDITGKVKIIHDLIRLEELGPEFQKIIEDDWNAFCQAKTGANMVKIITQLLKKIGEKADSILPDPSDYLEIAVKGGAFVYKTAGVMLSPTNVGSWLYRGCVSMNKEPEEVLENFEIFMGALRSWRGTMQEALEALQAYLEAVNEGQDIRKDWQSFLDCLWGLPGEPLSKDERDKLEDLFRESTKAATLSDCKKYHDLLQKRLEEIRKKIQELIGRCKKPERSLKNDIEEKRDKLEEIVGRLRRISEGLGKYFENVRPFIEFYAKR